MSEKARNSTTFTKRLRGVDAWSPDLAEYAVNYLVTNMSWPGMRLLVDLGELHPPATAFFKADLARFLIEQLTPAELASLWARYRREDTATFDQDVAF